MNRMKIFRRSFIAFLSVIFLLNASIAHAEIYIGEGSYAMSKAETLEVARERAKADAMRNAAEKAGTYVRSYSRMKNFELEEDVIETMTSNILKLIEKPVFKMLEGVDNLEGILIRVTVKVQIDDSDINRWLNKGEQEKSILVSQMEALRKANEEQARQIAELKRQLADKPKDKEIITKKFEDEDKIFLSNQKVEEGWKLYDKGDYNGAVKLFDEAVQLNPQNEQAYFGRGQSYRFMRQLERTIQDFNKAIEVNPNYADAYYYLGMVYCGGDLRQYENGIQYYDKVIQLNPNYADAYCYRGIAYYLLKNFKQALENYTKFIQFNPNKPGGYNLRGDCYRQLGDEEKAQADFAKAEELEELEELSKKG